MTYGIAADLLAALTGR